MPRKANYSKAERKKRALVRSKDRQKAISELWKIKKVYDACGIDLIEYFNQHKEIPPLKVEAKAMVPSSLVLSGNQIQSSSSAGKDEASEVEEEEDSNSESE